MLTQLPRPSRAPQRVLIPSPSEMDRRWMQKFMPREFAQQRGVRLLSATMVL